MPRTAPQARPDSIRPAPRFPTTDPLPSARDRGLVLDCLRVRDLGGDWLDHEAFFPSVVTDAVVDSLVRDGLAEWNDFGLHITPAGRRAWADQRRALRDIEVALPAPAPLPCLTSAFARRAATFGAFDGATT